MDYTTPVLVFLGPWFEKIAKENGALIHLLQFRL